MATPPDAIRTFEFWLGRAGSGKTWACLDSIAQHVIARPRGEPLLFLVPEQASASMEHALAHRIETLQQAAGSDSPPLRATTRARVLSFRRLKEEVFARLGGHPRRVVDEITRTLLLRRVIRRERDHLHIFGASADLPGLASSLSQSLAEFQRFGWGTDQLRERIHTLSAEGGSHEVLRRKLEDLERVWTGYSELLKTIGFEDLPRLNEEAAFRLEQWSEMSGARVWIDGFATFNEDELRLLDALMKQASWGCMALCLDPLDDAFVRLSDPEAELPPSRPRVGPQRTFEILEQTCLQIRARFRSTGWHTTEKTLPVSPKSTRFSGARVMETIESAVLTELNPPPERNAGWPTATTSACWPPGPLELLEAPGRKEEVEAVARRIAALLSPSPAAPPPASSPLDGSGIIVLVRDLETYAPLIRELFPRYGIPYFIDSTRALNRHPLARLLLSALRYARTGSWTSDLALDYLKTGLSPLSDAETIAQLQRLAERRRFLGRDWKQEDHWVARGAIETTEIAERTNRLFEAWREAAEPLESLRSRLLDDDQNPAESIVNFLNRLNVAERIDEWTTTARNSGNEETASIHERAVKNLEDLLIHLHQLEQHRPTPVPEDVTATEPPENVGASRYEHVDELEEVLVAALHDLRGRLIPPTQEQVIVGQIDRSRTSMNVRAAFVLGLADGEFPRVYDEDPILGDRERKLLARESGALGPDSSHRYSLERFFAYIALTRSSERLVVSYPMRGEQGRPLQPAAPYRALAEAFPIAGPRSTEEDQPFPTEGLPVRPETWASGITTDLHRAELGDSSALTRLVRLAHPSSALDQEPPESRRRAETAIGAIAWPHPTSLDPRLTRQFWTTQPSLSATGLEDYAACPYRFFVSRMLRLERPLDLTPGPLELGELRHALLERLFHELGSKQPVDWGNVDVHEAANHIDRIAPEVAREHLEDRFGRDALTEVLLNDAVEDIKVFVQVLRRMGERYGFLQVAAEYGFGPQQHAPLLIPAGKDLALGIRGSVDRVDALKANLNDSRPTLVLFDFKSSAQASQHTPARYLHGLSLQMGVYALALRAHFAPESSRQEHEHSGAAPANISGFFYWPLNLGLAREGPEDSTEPASDAWFEKHRAKGLFDAAIAKDLDTELAQSRKALAFGFSLTSKGAIARRGLGALESDGFDNYLEHVQSIVNRRALKIAGGEIAVEPLASPLRACDLCDFASVCRIATCPADAFRNLPGCSATGFRNRFESPGEESP